MAAVPPASGRRVQYTMIVDDELSDSTFVLRHALCSECARAEKFDDSGAVCERCFAEYAATLSA